mmetsp:Transcript_20932/g.70274  ORF Transcript_20932/g.70274 Transcript_20932/m.70274 type:complete len:295 (+) Transcript_20932:370-1254(+)
MRCPASAQWRAPAKRPGTFPAPPREFQPLPASPASLAASADAGAPSSAPAAATPSPAASSSPAASAAGLPASATCPASGAASRRNPATALAPTRVRRRNTSASSIWSGRRRVHRAEAAARPQAKASQTASGRPRSPLPGAYAAACSLLANTPVHTSPAPMALTQSTRGTASSQWRASASEVRTKRCAAPAPAVTASTPRLAPGVRASPMAASRSPPMAARSRPLPGSAKSRARAPSSRALFPVMLCSSCTAIFITSALPQARSSSTPLGQSTTTRGHSAAGPGAAWRKPWEKRA